MKQLQLADYDYDLDDLDGNKLIDGLGPERRKKERGGFLLALVMLIVRCRELLQHLYHQFIGHWQAVYLVNCIWHT